MNLRLVLRSFGWSLVSVPAVQRVDPRPVLVVHEDLVEAPARTRLRPSAAEVAA